MKLKPKQAEEIAEDPIKSAELANLVYFTEDKLSITRRRHGRGFVYFKNDQKINDLRSLERFKKLVIPPAWEDVRISPIVNSHLQVIGKDNKGRKQYRYHTHWEQIRNSTKFFRMSAFGKALPQIRTAIAKDLNQKTMTKRKCLALVIRLMEETHIRIGNEQYAQNNKTYGLSTLRNKHIEQEQNNILFRFKGKKGKMHTISLENKRLQKLVMQCKDIPGWELFQYYDEEGNHHAIDSGMVNSYIQEISDDSFSSKDFRTWAASKIFLEALTNYEKPETKTHLKQNLIDACDVAAKSLGNTRSVCRNYYIHPALIEKYEQGELSEFIDAYKESSSKITELDYLERGLLEIINGYNFNISN